MATGRISMCGLSLYLVVLLAPLPSLAGPDAKMCKEDMETIYKSIADFYSLELLKQQSNPDSPARKFMEKSLPQFKEKCGPLEANSVRDLENGKYFRDLVANREKLKKSHGHVKSVGAISDSELSEDFSLQQ